MPGKNKTYHLYCRMRLTLIDYHVEDLCRKLFSKEAVWKWAGGSDRQHQSIMLKRWYPSLLNLRRKGSGIVKEIHAKMRSQMFYLNEKES